MPAKLANQLAHILSRCEADATGCWAWSGAKDAHGYGRIGKRTYGEHRVHIYVWKQLEGAIPQGHELDHLCRNTSCCNPTHLEPKTHRDNVLAGNTPSAITYRTDTCARGHSMADAYVKARGRECRSCALEARRIRDSGNPDRLAKRRAWRDRNKDRINRERRNARRGRDE